jgi:putative transposase
VVLDGDTQKSVGYDAGGLGTATQWLAALHMAGNQQVPDGARGKGLSLMSEHGCQPTSLAFMEACSTLESPQAFTSDHNPKGNAETERVSRTRQEECRWLQAWTCPCALVSALAACRDDDHEHYLHAALGYTPPRQFEREYSASHSPPFVAA